MPFRKGARITLRNESRKDLNLLFFDIDFITTKKADPEALYFHASYNRAKPLPLGEDMTLLEGITGKGRFLGISAGVNVNPAYKPSWWGEGEVKLYIDGDKLYPTINGSGAEDYIGTGWMEGVFVNEYQGCLLADAKEGRYAFYRFHIPDQVVFYQDFRATIQQIGGWFAGDVKKMIAARVPLKPVSLSGRQGFRALLTAADPQKLIDTADDEDWLNFTGAMIMR